MVFGLFLKFINAMLNENHIQFIEKNSNADVNQLMLKGIPFEDISPAFIVQQIQARQNLGKKLPNWVKNRQLVFPPKLNLSQSSSEFTANYKAKIIRNTSVVDLTGGFGVDAFALAQANTQLTYIETNNELLQLVKHNAEVFGIQNITFVSTTAEKYLEAIPQKTEWMYIDPSRRDAAKQKVFLFEDCTPNILELVPSIQRNCKFLLLKTSPLIDINYGIKALKYVNQIHILAMENDVKELLWELDFSTENDAPHIKTIHFKKQKLMQFDLRLEMKNQNLNYSLPLNFLYEPNPALMKAGVFDELASRFQVCKLHPHSHLFTSDEEIANFPGRSFKIENLEAYKPKVLKKRWKGKKMNISTRNFPIMAKHLIKLLNTKDGGDNYVFFTTDINQQKIVISCTKIT